MTTVNFTNQDHPVLTVLLLLIKIDEQTPEMSDKDRAYAVAPLCGLSGREILAILDLLCDKGDIDEDFKPTERGRCLAVQALAHLAGVTTAKAQAN